MQRARWLTCCWPGMARLWLKGHWSGLFTALLFAGLLNLALASQYIWPELLPPPLAWSLWLGVAGFWIHGLVQSVRQFPRLAAKGPTALLAARESRDGSPPDDDIHPEMYNSDLFETAQQEYLKHNWYEAETLLRKILLDCDTDINARMTLAALYRHNGRLKEAQVELSRAARCDGSDEWAFEIQQQQMLLKEMKTNSSEETESADSVRPAA